jgi:predicted NAD/FAD-binding protein
MQLGVEFGRSAHLESVSVTAGMFMRFQHHDLLAAVGHQCGKNQPGDATPNNQEICFGISFVHTSRTIPRLGLRLHFINAPVHDGNFESTMHVVIIGGGAAGMASAHYLAQVHQVTVLERQPLLGGNIRTLNRNVETNCLPAGIFIDNGVIEFHHEHSPGLRALVGELALELESFPGGSTGMYLECGRSFHMPGAIWDQRRGAAIRALQYLRLAWLMRRLVPIGLRMRQARKNPGGSVAGFLGEDSMSRWLKMLLMYGYSIPFRQIDEFPASMAIPTLLQGSIGTRWVRLAGGTYRYIEEIIRQAGNRLTVQAGQEILAVRRNTKGVCIECPDRVIQADRLVFATPPDQVLSLLEDATEEERAWFSNWRPNYAETVIHTDESLYADWKIRGFTEFDLFEKEGGKDAGYNAWLNRLCGLPESHDTNYFLAFNLEDRIDPQKILDRQRHHTPLYTTRAVASVDEIKAANGRNNTYYAGAYLYNGLHEGAVQSALAIKSLFF